MLLVCSSKVSKFDGTNVVSPLGSKLDNINVYSYPTNWFATPPTVSLISVGVVDVISFAIFDASTFVPFTSTYTVISFVVIVHAL